MPDLDTTHADRIRLHLAWAAGERRWTDTYSCGHSRVVCTFLGDHDRPDGLVGDHTVCMDCPHHDGLRWVMWVSVVPVPLEEWLP